MRHAFVSRKRRRVEGSTAPSREPHRPPDMPDIEDDAGSTDIKIATLASLYPSLELESLLDVLISADGVLEKAIELLEIPPTSIHPGSQFPRVTGFQTSLSPFQCKSDRPGATTSRLTPLTRKGITLHLYSPEDIAAHTPCSIILNILPTSEANELLKELLEEATTFGQQSIKVFENVVQSPHTACFYVDSLEDLHEQKTKYLYNGSFLEDVRQITPTMRSISSKVKPAVNGEIAKRIKNHYPGGKKLKHQSPDQWIPNAAFVNCYKGGAESVGYHCDHLTYLGPRAVIGSLSLGVAREFRVRKIVARDNEDGEPKGRKWPERADMEGQIAIHLPHNSLLVMHAEMQEEWKHSIHPAAVIDPHPIASNKRINVTYRYYRESFHPKNTPRCRCGIATVLSCVQRSIFSTIGYFPCLTCSLSFE